jgi:hypothetical protein
MLSLRTGCDWKAQALYYAEKCQQLGTELGNIRHHLAASCATVKALMGNTRDFDPAIVSATLDSHWWLLFAFAI